MKAQLITILNTGPEFRHAPYGSMRSPEKHVKNIKLPDNYDGNPYGNTVPFVIGSNQYIITDPDDFLPETN